MEIRKAAVIGSGTMGSGIAAHIANANIPVILLDIVPQGAQNRNILAEKAVERMKQQTNNPPFSIPEKAAFISCGNLEDDLALLQTADWIIEAVVEKLPIKQEIYRKITPLRKHESILSSNTSTIPLAELAEGLPDNAHNLCITHFYNPPRYTGLLEIVAGSSLDEQNIATLVDFCDRHLGKKVVMTKDTPGFIGNRIGIYWMIVGLSEAIKQGMTVEEADGLLSTPLGIPKTGVFGLFDLIGLDVMMDIITSLEKNLPKSDLFFEAYDSKALLKHMIEEGYTGRKGKGGFYRVTTENGIRIKETMDLTTGRYRPTIQPTIYIPPEGLRIFYSYRSWKKSRLLEPALEGSFHESPHQDNLPENPNSPEHIRKEALYAWSVMSRTLAYAASLVPEIANDIVAVDTVMRTGFNWTYGPFKMIDQLGTEWFSSQLLSEGRPLPPLLKSTGNRPFYTATNDNQCYMTIDGQYAPLPVRPESWMLKDKIFGKTPLLQTTSARLWDIGDGIACLEFTSKMNTLDTTTFDCFAQSLELVKQHFQGLVIGNNAKHFSAGLNLNLILTAAHKGDWPEISRILRMGQQTMMDIKYAPFPVVAAVSGMALGGGCEMLLHCDAVQAHLETNAGLVEVNIGVVPSWGGCTEMLYHHIHQEAGSTDILATISHIFDIISSGIPSTSGDEARKMGYLRERNHITMNRERLLPDAKARCLSLAENYQPPEPYSITLPFVAIKEALSIKINSLMDEGLLTAHDVRIRHYLATILSGGPSESDQPITEQKFLDLEHDAFMELVHTKETQERIEYTLKTGTPLKN